VIFSRAWETLMPAVLKHRRNIHHASRTGASAQIQRAVAENAPVPGAAAVLIFEIFDDGMSGA